jgi:Ca-activated chloride channel family protein
MSFLWPELLWLMLAVPALPVLYLLLLRRTRRGVLRYSDLTAVRAASGKRWRRHVPPALLLIACGLALFATARPVGRLTLPWTKSTVMLAMDVSLSMRVDDVKPTRMAAAQVAAKAFLGELPKGVEVGLVTFAANAQVVQTATRDRTALIDAIDRFQMQLGTAVGSAIVLSLAELFPEEQISLEELTLGPRRKSRTREDQKAALPTPATPPVAPGSYEAAAIILLSDGRRTTGVDTLAAAKMAADHGVRIYVIGLGTVDGAASAPDGMAIYMKLDEPTLREVARMTGGEYHYAGTSENLRSVYEHLGSRVQVQSRELELTAPIALLAAIALVTGMGLSIAWFGRVA